MKTPSGYRKRNFKKSKQVDKVESADKSSSFSTTSYEVTNEEDNEGGGNDNEVNEDLIETQPDKEAFLIKL